MTIKRDAQWFIQVLDAMEELVLVKGVRSKLLWGNKAFRDIYGLSNETMQDMVDAPQSDPDNTLQYVRDDHQVFTTGKTLSMIEPITTTDGVTLTLDTTKSAIFDASGKTERTVGVSRIIDDKKPEVNADRREERKTVAQTLRTIVSGLPLATVLLDVQSRIVASSQGFKKIASHEEADDFEEVFDANDALLMKIQKVIREGGEETFPSYRLTKTKQTFDIIVQEWFLPGEQRGGVMITLNDVTALRVNERKLKELNEELRQKNEALTRAKDEEKQQLRRVSTLLNTLSNAVIVCGADGEVELLNDEATKIFGRSIQKTGANLNANHVHMFDGNGARLEQERVPIARALDGESVVHELVMVPEPETENKNWFDVSARPFTVGDDRGAVAVFTNITERIKLQNDLEEFAYISSHDLQEPLRMVSSYLSLLQEEFGESLSGDALLYMRFAIDGSKRMQRLVHDLLKFSKSDSKELNPEAIKLDKILSEIKLNYSVAIKEADASIELSGDNELTCDALALGQILANLIGNAIKFHRDGVKPVVKVHCQETPSRWTITVSDNGIGISEDFAQNCFKIFKRAHNNDKYSGTGIGLAMVKRLSSRLGGNISVTSEMNKGSTFTLTIPSRRVHQAKEIES